MSLIHTILDPITIIKAIGLLGVWFIIFAESGLFFGFFLPGDSLLFTAGFLASQDFFPSYVVSPVVLLFLGSFCAAVIGDNAGFAFGRRVGPAIFSRENSLFFDKKYPIRVQKFYERYGKKTIILARFVPIVRTFAPIVAGIGSMNYRTFFFFNIMGGLLWTSLLIFMGYFLGRIIPNASSYVTLIIGIIIFLSFVPVITQYLKTRKI